MDPTQQQKMRELAAKPYWHYYVITDNRPESWDMRITGGEDHELVFAKPQPVALNDGRSALLIASLDPFPIATTDHLQLKLVGRKSDAGEAELRTLMIGLPFPVFVHFVLGEGARGANVAAAEVFVIV